MKVLEEKFYALCGVSGAVAAWSCVLVAVTSGVDWRAGMLSEVGHAVVSPVAPVFNFCLVLSGFLITVYSVTVFREYARYTSFFLLVSGFTVQLLAVFNPVYAGVHWMAAVAHFMMLTVASVVYTLERESYLALASLVVTLGFWAVYGLGVYPMGIAVPEMVSKIVMIWVAHSGVKLYTQHSRG